MVAAVAATAFVALLDSTNLLGTTAIATTTVAFEHSAAFLEDEIPVDRDETRLSGLPVGGLSSDDLPASILEDFLASGASRIPDLLRVDENIDDQSRRGRVSRVLRDDSRGTTTTAVEGQKEDRGNHHDCQQQPLSMVNGRSRELKRTSSRSSPSVSTIGRPVTDRTAAVRGDRTGGWSATDKVSPLVNGSARCFEDPNGVNRCQANIFFFGVSKCGERCGCLSLYTLYPSYLNGKVPLLTNISLCDTKLNVGASQLTYEAYAPSPGRFGQPPSEYLSSLQLSSQSHDRSSGGKPEPLSTA